jgi:hypothetical protein
MNIKRFNQKKYKWGHIGYSLKNWKFLISVATEDKTLILGILCFFIIINDFRIWKKKQ